jgi:general secretion pathway protein E
MVIGESHLLEFRNVCASGMDLTEKSVLAAVARVVTRELLLGCGACPVFATDDDVLDFDVSSDSGEALAREIGAQLCVKVRCQRRDADSVTAGVERFANRHFDRGSDRVQEAVDSSDLTDPRSLATQPPVVRYVNLLIREALAAGASDIHLDGTSEGLDVRLRVDGVLTPGPVATDGLQSAILSRWKLLADLDISERRRPQDGRIRTRVGDTNVDLRLSTVPCLHGESAVIRVLDRSAGAFALENLGIPPGILDELYALIRRPNGLLLVTGPTGSGKTTTLYSALAERANGREKVISVEDPIEIQVDGVTQVPLHREVGTSFASILRALLRHDPDVLMIGELRDAETAAVAVQASMTGHLVLATLHTNDAVSSVSRLVDLEVPRFLIADTLTGVLAQRLVRRLCGNCAEPARDTGAIVAAARDVLPPDEALLVLPAVRRAVGCPECRRTGFQGRVGIFEFMTVTDESRRRILRPDADHGGSGIADSVQPLIADGFRKVLAGITTIDEVQRAIAA